jgi:hypothetical protein
LQKEKNDTSGNNFVLAKEPPTNIYDQSETKSGQTGKMELGRYEGRLTKEWKFLHSLSVSKKRCVCERLRLNGVWSVNVGRGQKIPKKMQSET